MEQNVIQINGRIMMNVDVILKSIMYVKKIIFGKYLASIMDDSVITCDEGIEWYDEEIKTVSTNFNEKI